MKINGTKIIFGQSDMNFVKKFGIIQSSEMVLDYKSVNNLPFIYDIYQLTDFLGVTRKELFYMVKNCDSLYNDKTINKKDGGERNIQIPNERLKWHQKCINFTILSKMPVSKYAKAYVRGAKLIDNALPHVGKKYILKLDITDFFGSICFNQVYNTAFNTKYFPKQIGYILTTLCCRNECLPQGAPTSPALSNIVMKNFDDNIGRWCEKRGISYTRYCDDMTFSSNEPLYQVYRKVKGMLDEMGFELNEKKTHFITNINRQSVTGLTVNEKVTVSKDYKRKLRQEVHYVLKYGLTDCIIHSCKTEYMFNDRVNAEDYFYHLLGQINYVLQIEPENTWFNEKLKELIDFEHKHQWRSYDVQHYYWREIEWEN